MIKKIKQLLLKLKRKGSKTEHGTYKYGCNSDIKDDRDYLYENKLMATTTTYADIDLRDDCMPPIFDQGSTGSCTAQTGVCIFWYQLNRIKKVIGERLNEEYSRMFSYYMARFLDFRVERDCGSTLRSMGQCLQKFGATNSRYYAETLKFDTEPNFYSLAYGCTNKIDAYYRITTKEGIIDALSKKIPVAISTDINKFGYVDSNGLVRNSLTWNSKTSCNHAMVIVGYKQNYNYYGVNTEVFIVRNSWGTSFGSNGYCYIPCDKLINYNLEDAWAYIKDKFDSDLENDKYIKRVF